MPKNGFLNLRMYNGIVAMDIRQSHPDCFMGHLQYITAPKMLVAENKSEEKDIKKDWILQNNCISFFIS